MNLEAQGTPAVLVGTSQFVAVCGSAARMAGRPDMQWAVVDHPVGSLGPVELRARAEQAVPQIARIIAPQVVMRPDGSLRTRDRT